MRVASGSRPAVAATIPAGSRMSAARDRLPQQPAAIAAQVEHDALRRTRAGETLLDRARQMAFGAAVEGGHLHNQHVAAALREHRLRRHHGALHLGGAWASVAATPADNDLGSFRPVDPAGHCGGVLAAR